MADAPPNLQHAARTAAARVEKLLLEMLIANQLGEVTVVVGYSQLEPLRTIIERAPTVKVGRGRMEMLERAE